MSRFADAQKKLMDALDTLESTLALIPAPQPEGTGAPAPAAPSDMPPEMKSEILAEIARIDADIEAAMACIDRGAAADTTASGEAE